MVFRIDLDLDLSDRKLSNDHFGVAGFLDALLSEGLLGSTSFLAAVDVGILKD